MRPARSPASFVAMADRPVLVVGLGNPVLGDDAVGWRVVDAVEERLATDSEAAAAAGPVEVDHLCAGGLRLMERVVGYDRVVVADAVLGPDLPGTVWSRPLAMVVSGRMGHLDSSHDASLTAALAAGRALGVGLPDDITIVGVAVARTDTFAERLTPPVEAAVPRAAEAIVSLLRARTGLVG